MLSFPPDAPDFPAARMARAPKSMPRLLIISTSQLPAVVHSLQVATSLRSQREDLHLTWLVRDTLAPLVRLSPAVDELIVFSREGGIRNFLQTIRRVREQDYDYVFDMQGLLRTGFVTWRARGDRKVGRADAREGASIFYHEKTPLPPDGEGSHRLQMQLQFAHILGVKPELRGSLQFRDPPGLLTSHLLAANGSKPILMFPDSRQPWKRWEGFRELTDLVLNSAQQGKVVWAGHRYLDFKNPPGPDRFLNLTDSTSIVALPAMIRSASLVISNDSGPMHLAAALGVPTVAIFGSSDPRRYGPYPLNDPKHQVIIAPVGNLKLLSARDVYNRVARFAGFPELKGPPRVRGF